MNTIQIFTLASRPKTLVAVLSPVLIASALSFHHPSFHPIVALFTLLCGLGIQITTNLANDLFDFIKEADTSERKGPLRVTQAGLLSIRSMIKMLSVTMVFTILCGCYLVWQGGFPIAILLSLSLLFAILYTAGPYPLAYLGLGEIFVLLFFGPVATAATYYLQTHTLSWDACILGIPSGLLSTALLSINNLRDIDEDRQACKNTLAVRFGKRFAQIESASLILLTPLPLLSMQTSFLPFCFLIPAFPVCQALFRYRLPQELNLILGKTGQLLWIYTLLLLIQWLY